MQMRSIGAALVTSAVLCCASSAAAQAPKLTWGPAPAVFPAGAKMAVLAGNPGKSEPFTVRLDMPNNYLIKPHFHPTDEKITVISGTFHVGMSDKVDTKHATELKKGGTVTAAANMHHWAHARGHTIVEVHAMGPFVLTYVDPSDDPSKKGKRS